MIKYIFIIAVNKKKSDSSGDSKMSEETIQSYENYGEAHPEWEGEDTNKFVEMFWENNDSEQKEEEKKPVIQKKTECDTSTRLPVVSFHSPEIYHLIYEQAQIKKFQEKTSFNLSTFRNEEYIKNELLTVKFKEVKSKKIYQYLEYVGTKKKIEMYYKRLMKENLEEIPKKKRYYEKLLREYVKSIPTVPLQQSWIDSILSKLHNLHLKFPILANDIMDEVKTDFFEKMHQFGVDIYMKCLPGETKEVHELPMVEEVGKTARYHVYLLHRQMLKSRLHLLHKFQIKIFTLSVKVLPEVLVDFRKYKAMGFMELSKLETIFLAELKKSEHLIKTSLYSKVVSLISRKRALNDIPINARPKYIASATNILVVQVHVFYCVLLLLFMNHKKKVYNDNVF